MAKVELGNHVVKCLVVRLEFPQLQIWVAYNLSDL